MGAFPFCLKKRMLHDAEEQKWEKLRVSFISQFSWVVILSGSVPILSADSQGEIRIVLLSFNSNKKKSTQHTKIYFIVPFGRQGKIFFHQVNVDFFHYPICQNPITVYVAVELKSSVWWCRQAEKKNKQIKMTTKQLLSYNSVYLNPLVFRAEFPGSKPAFPSSESCILVSRPLRTLSLWLPSHQQRILI